jgi:hypothetical protein
MSQEPKGEISQVKLWNKVKIKARGLKGKGKHNIGKVQATRNKLE